MAGGKFADRIVSNHSNVVFLWVAPQPPCHYLKDPLYAMSKRVKTTIPLFLGVPLLAE
jgi:hypothetical protein